MSEVHEQDWRRFFGDPERVESEAAAIIASARPTPEADAEARKRWEHSDDEVSRLLSFRAMPTESGGEEILVGDAIAFAHALRRGAVVHADWWRAAPAYRDLKAFLAAELGGEGPAHREALLALLPHVIRTMTVVWDGADGARVLMRLKDGGSEKKPASVIGFPQALLFPHDTDIGRAAERHARMAFDLFPLARPRFRFHEAWDVLWPERPELILVKQVLLDSDPEACVAGWQEEGVYPYVWIPDDALEGVMDGDNALLRGTIEVADAYYRAKARHLEKRIVVDEACGCCGRAVRSHCESVAPKTMLSVADDLDFDPATRSLIEHVAALEQVAYG